MANKPIPQHANGRKELPIEFIKAILNYNPSTGIFRWKKRSDISPKADHKANKIAGSIDKDGYICIQINKKRYGAHRLAWVIMTGTWPKHDIDHREPPRTDNRWNNLREATRRQNLRNMRKRPNNKSGFKWVSWCKIMKAWKAQIRNDKTNLYLGCYKTPEEAHAVACEAAQRLHENFARFK